MDDKHRLEAGIKELFERRDAEVLMHKVYWWEKAEINRNRMGIDSIPFDESQRHIPYSEPRDTFGVPTRKLPKEWVQKYKEKMNACN